MSPNELITTALVACTLLGLVLLRRVLRRGLAGQQPDPDTPPPENTVVIDGSNVMHWKDGTPDLSAVRLVVDALMRKGFVPGVVFDANAGYLLTGRYQHDGALSQALGLPEERVMVVPKATPADPFILTAARDMNARVVTNDRFRDWAGCFPEIRTAGYLIRGSIKNGHAELHLTPRKRRKKSKA